MPYAGHGVGVMSVLILHWDITMGAAFGAGYAYPSGAPDFNTSFPRDSCCHANFFPM